MNISNIKISNDRGHRLGSFLGIAGILALGIGGAMSTQPDAWTRERRRRRVRFRECPP